MKFYRRLLKQGWMISTLGFIASLYIRFVFLTVRWDWRGFKEIQGFWQKGFIMTFWHNRLMLMPLSWKGESPCHMLISNHSDGILISKAVNHFGIKTISGSTSHGGVKALKTLIKLLKEDKQVGITPDGPRGPRFEVSPGTVQLAMLSGKPVIPFCISISRRKIVSSWDRFMIPLPFARGIITAGKPLYPPQERSGESLEAFRLLIEKTMLRQASQSDAELGQYDFNDA